MGSLALATGQGFPVPKLSDDDEARHRREIATVVQNIMQGKMNVVGSLTLAANAATTTLMDHRIGANSSILLMPTTSDAAAALGGVYFTGFGDGTCTVNHANNAQTDRTFKYSVIG